MRVTAALSRGGALLVAAALGASACSESPNEAQRWDLADAVPPQFTPCTAPDARERRMFDIAATAIELTPADHSNSLGLGAEQYLAHGGYRRIGNDSVPVCVPDDILARVAAVFRARGFFNGQLVEFNLTLATRLPHDIPGVVSLIAGSAFAPYPQQSEILATRDIRPYARAVLATFGDEAKPYAAAAYAQMGNDTSLATGAAQIAAAAHHPGALERIERMMEEVLSRIPSDRAIPSRQKKRLYELAWALSASGAEGKRHSAPIHEIMGREVEAGSFFGTLEVKPKRFCRVLQQIEGDAALERYPYCADPGIPIDQ